jgi:uncharacterized protein (TIGR02147 family)
VRSWAKQMGLTGHSTLSGWLNEKRPILFSHIDLINQSLQLSTKELKYFESIVGYFSAQGAEKDFYEKQILLYHPSNESTYLNEQYFEIISKWLHMAILEMTQLPDFQEDRGWIQQKLVKSYSLEEIDEALNRLKGMGLLIKDGAKVVKTSKRLTTPKDRPHVAIQEHHREVMKLASEQIGLQSVDERCYDTCTMTIDSTRMDEAKQLILKFREDMGHLMEKKGGDKTYQLAVQFFRVTKD